jgi:hypothetical protein
VPPWQWLRKSKIKNFKLKIIFFRFLKSWPQKLQCHIIIFIFLNSTLEYRLTFQKNNNILNSSKKQCINFVIISVVYVFSPFKTELWHTEDPISEKDGSALRNWWTHVAAACNPSCYKCLVRKLWSLLPIWRVMGFLCFFFQVV